MSNKYIPRIYWAQRLANQVDISTVGHKNLGYIYNYWLYKRRFQALNRALKTISLDVTGKSVIELGVGSGAWIPFWQKQGAAKIVGLDVTLVSVLTLARKYPSLNFVQGDLGSTLPFSQGESFDIVTAFDVLFHITDDVEFSRAISNISKLVKPGGWTIISDSFCQSPSAPSFHQHYRTHNHYLETLQAVDLEIFHIQPIFFAMTTPLCSSNLVLSHFVQTLFRIVRKLAARRETEWLNHGVGFPLYLNDTFLGKITTQGPGLKILMAKKV